MYRQRKGVISSRIVRSKIVDVNAFQRGGWSQAKLAARPCILAGRKQSLLLAHASEAGDIDRLVILLHVAIFCYFAMSHSLGILFLNHLHL